jgi:NhaP-type Na+/H+ or K+/H+ antiporter
VGVIVPLVAILLLRIPGLRASERYEPLGCLLGRAGRPGHHLRHPHQRVPGGVRRGVTVATAAPELRETFHPFGETLTELLKLASLLVLGALIDVEVIAEVGWRGGLFALLVLVLARPAAIAIALCGRACPDGSGSPWPGSGPRGSPRSPTPCSCSRRGVGFAGEVFVLTAGAVGLSILLHSTTDVPMTHAFFRRRNDRAR